MRNRPFGGIRGEKENILNNFQQNNQKSPSYFLTIFRHPQFCFEPLSATQDSSTSLFTSLNFLVSVLQPVAVGK